MNKKYSFGTLLCAILLAGALTFSATMVFSTITYNQKILNLYERQSMYEKLEELDRIARYDSIFNIDEKLLAQGLMEGYLAGIGDSEATYVSAADAKALSQGQGIEVGIGVKTVRTSSKYLYVYEVLEGSGASVAGIAVGDTIIKVNSEDVTQLTDSEAYVLLHAAEGTEVKVDFYRGGEQMSLTPVSQTYSTTPVTYRILDYSIGYMRITAFDANTYNQFIKAINNMTSPSEPITGLIIDLRHTSGGDIGTAAQILDRMLPEGDIMSKTLRDGTVQLVYTSDKLEFNLPVAVLTDSATAGPAELFAAAMADYGKASVVGTRTAGKGTIKKTFTLSDGSKVMLATAIINPPKSATFNGVGVKPDYSVEPLGTGDYDFYTMTAENDTQYKKAFDVVYSQIDLTSINTAPPVVSEVPDF
ncbi:MAG TPA: S41 family peptidase [Oscillospiraceae bacterium]|nr:S41 family peptidase [Oscillospiraceae bacterium]HPS34615.1 S41 family peptidase [Oscillospiraceae bacterium]